jgi:hypothetical protein
MLIYRVYNNVCGCPKNNLKETEKDVKSLEHVRFRHQTSLLGILYIIEVAYLEYLYSIIIKV